jgi:hypothetical protein
MTPCLISVDIFFNNGGMSKHVHCIQIEVIPCYSFYPIFPVPLDLSSDVNLDISHSEGLKVGSDPNSTQEYAPDILVIPSRLKHFSKVNGVTSHSSIALIFV